MTTPIASITNAPAIEFANAQAHPLGVVATNLPSNSQNLNQDGAEAINGTPTLPQHQEPISANTSCQLVEAERSRDVECQIRRCRLGWQVLFPHNRAAGLSFFSYSELAEFIDSCDRPDLDQITHCPDYWYAKAQIFSECPF